MLIDTHAHLNFRKQTEEFDEQINFHPFDDEIPHVLKRAHAQGVDVIIDVGDTLEDSKVSIDLSEKYAELYSAVGIHPHATIRDRYDASMGQLRSLANSSQKIVAIGEIGLDYSRTDYNIDSKHIKNYKVVQKKYFRGQLDCARSLHLPVIIHARDCFQDLQEILKDHAWENLPKVIHCFTATSSVAQSFIELGCMISYTGIITFPKNDELIQTVKQTPLSKIMIETDSPFLAPQLVRGQRNEPAYVAHVAKKIAEIQGISFEEVAQATSKNAQEFFQISV